MDSETVEGKRRYTRLEPSTWAAICAEWEVGDTTLNELSERHGVAVRTLQLHFQHNQVIKGSKAAALAMVVKKAVYDESLAEPELLRLRAKHIREQTYNTASLIDDLLASQIDLAQRDPSSSFKVASAVKMLSLAAATLERTHQVKLRALGLDRADSLGHEIPALFLRDITQAETNAIQNGDDENDDEIIEEFGELDMAGLE